MQSFPFPPPPWRRPPVMRWPKPEQPYALKIEVDAAKRATEEVKADLSEHETNGTIHVTAENKTAWNGKYDKPATGIPRSDLAYDVKASLAKADTALQQHQDISGKADKSDTYTKTEVDSLVSAVGGKFIVVTSLPSAASADPKAIYLVPRSPGESGNIYDEYLRVEPTTGTYAWEKIGSTEVDLSAYRTASAQDAIDGAQNTAIAAKYTKPSGGIPVSDLASGVIPSVPVKAVKRNGAALTPDANGAVNVEVPTSAAAIGAMPSTATGASIVAGVGGTTTIAQALNQLDEDISTKQDAISDLATIRSGAAAGATAVQPSGLANYVQKSQTAGLLKNDGTVDTTQYLTAHQDISGKLDAAQRNLLAYASTTTLALGTAVYRSALNADGTFPTITDTAIPTASAYYQFELELAVPSTVPSTITGPSGWVWLDGHGLPDPADLAGGETICISVRLDCTARTFLASVWRVA